MPPLLEFIGNTPLVELQHINPNPNVRVLGKLEGNNPGGSVKDRAAYGMIKGALDRGEIDQNSRLIEATSGNTGIALAMIARLFNLNIELIMPENSTKERVQTMKAYGAKVTLTSAAGSMEAARDYADQQVAGGTHVMLNQFGNSDNFLMHYKTTGPEIWKDTGGQVTHFVSSMGTTGTIMGVSRFLKEQSADIQIVGCQPTEGSRIPGIRRWPKEYLPTIFEPSRVDRTIDIAESDARNMTKRLAAEEAIFAGMSSGGAGWAAIEIAKEIRKGVVVFIVCDRGDRYLSSDLFE